MQGQDSGYSRLNSVEPTKLEREVLWTTHGIQRRLLDASHNRPGQFAQELTEVLKEFLDAEAATFYINCPETGSFKLKAACGFEYGGYSSFVLPNPSYLSESCRGPHFTPIWATAPFSTVLYRDTALLDSIDAGGLVAAPVVAEPTRFTDAPNPVGAVCVYLSPERDLRYVAEVLAALSALVGSLYTSALSNLLMEIRTFAVEKVIFDTSLGKASSRFLDLLKRHLCFESGGLWLANPRRDLLYLRRLTGGFRSRRVALMRHEIPLSDQNNPLVRSFGSGIPLIHLGPKESSRSDKDDWAERVELDRGRVLEKLPSGDLENGLVFPLSMPKTLIFGSSEYISVGVLTVLNKYNELGGYRHYSSITWEDRAILDFCAQVVAVMSFQSLRGMDNEAEYERRMHGVKSAVMSVRHSLQQLEERSGVEFEALADLRYHLPNGVERLRELEGQINRSDRTRRSNLRIRRTKTYQQVILPAVRHGRRQAQSNGLDDSTFEIIGARLMEIDRDRLPDVTGDHRALLTVFRNLFENSIKYRDRDLERLSITISYRLERPTGMLVLGFEDNGIGIDDREKANIFRESYRGRVARRVHMHGQGIGLYECKDLMERMNGYIDVMNTDTRAGTRFELRLPTRRR